jgi:hypothetical protein
MNLACGDPWDSVLKPRTSGPSGEVGGCARLRPQDFGQPAPVVTLSQRRAQGDQHPRSQGRHDIMAVPGLGIQPLGVPSDGRCPLLLAHVVGLVPLAVMRSIKLAFGAGDHGKKS